MADIQISLKNAGPQGEISIIQARGFIDTTTAPELERKLEELLAQERYRIIIDLSSIDYISSAGWGVFVSEIREIRENSGDLILLGMTPDVYDVYELMEFSTILKAYDTLEDALTGFGIGEARPAVSKSQRRIEIKTIPQEEKQAVRKEEVKIEPSPQPSPSKAPGSPVGEKKPLTVEDKIIDIVSQNPYYGTSDIIRALRTEKYGKVKVGFFEMRRLLKRLGLDNKQKRFELALKRNP